MSETFHFAMETFWIQQPLINALVFFITLQVAQHEPQGDLT